MSIEGGGIFSEDVNATLERLQTPGLCVLASVYSMVCEQYGRAFDLPQHLIDFRLSQISSSEAVIADRRVAFSREDAGLNGVAWHKEQEEFERHLDLVTSRLDAMKIREFMKRIAVDQSDLGRAVRDCQVVYESGRFSDARYWITRGYSVGILTAWMTIQGRVPHMYHLGLNERDEFYNLSDVGSSAPLDSFQIRFYENAMISRIRRPGDWNLLLMKADYYRL